MRRQRMDIEQSLDALSNPPFAGRFALSRAELIADGVVHAAGLVLTMAGGSALLVMSAFRYCAGRICRNGILCRLAAGRSASVSCVYNLWPVSPAGRLDSPLRSCGHLSPDLGNLHAVPRPAARCSDSTPHDGRGLECGRCRHRGEAFSARTFRPAGGGFLSGNRLERHCHNTSAAGDFAFVHSLAPCHRWHRLFLRRRLLAWRDLLGFSPPSGTVSFTLRRRRVLHLAAVHSASFSPDISLNRTHSKRAPRDPVRRDGLLAGVPRHARRGRLSNSSQFRLDSRQSMGQIRTRGWHFQIFGSDVLTTNELRPAQTVEPRRSFSFRCLFPGHRRLHRGNTLIVRSRRPRHQSGIERTDPRRTGGGICLSPSSRSSGFSRGALGELPFRAGSEATEPVLLAPMKAALLSRSSSTALSTLSLRTILDPIATRLDESRDISPLSDRSADLPSACSALSGIAAYDRFDRRHDPGTRSWLGQRQRRPESLKTGLSAPLEGMLGTAFRPRCSACPARSSLVSSTCGGRAQTRFYTELENWLSWSPTFPPISGHRCRQGGTADEIRLLSEHCAACRSRRIQPARGKCHGEPADGISSRQEHAQRAAMMRDWVQPSPMSKGAMRATSRKAAGALKSREPS